MPVWRIVSLAARSMALLPSCAAVALTCFTSPAPKKTRVGTLKSKTFMLPSLLIEDRFYILNRYDVLIQILPASSRDYGR